MTTNPIAAAARNVFDTYAHLDHPDLPGDELPSLQVRLARWQNENFGAQPAERMVRGMIEELGEMEDSITDEERFDAVGDVMVYSVQLCTAFRLDFGSLWLMRDTGAIPNRMRDGTLSATVSALGRISHITLKRDQKIRNFADDEFARASMAWALATFYRHFALDALGFGVKPIEALTTTAEKVVLKRNWKTNAANGGA